MTQRNTIGKDYWSKLYNFVAKREPGGRKRVRGETLYN